MRVGGAVRRGADPPRPGRKTASGRRTQAIARVLASSAPRAAEEAGRVLAGGGTVVLPTDTVYGIAASLGNPAAVGRIFEIKHRPADKPLPVLAESLDEALQLGSFSAEAESAARAGWPGALTIVVPAVRPLPQLGGDGLTVGIRVPGHPFALEVLRRCGPLAATSANLSGRPTAQTIDELGEALREEVDLCLDGGRLSSSPSRVVSFVGSQQVLRQ